MIKFKIKNVVMFSVKWKTATQIKKKKEEKKINKQTKNQ